MTEKNGDLKYKTDNAIDEAYRRGFEDGFGKSQADAYRKGYEDGKEHEQMLRTPKHDADRIEQIKDLIRESDKNHAYTLSYPAYVFISRLKKIVGWQIEDYEERKTDEIKVGDEVYDKYNPYPRVVTSINKQDMADLIDARGNAYSDSVFCLKKTGRHYPQIAEVLEQMRKESEYHADPYHADFAWDVKTVIDNFRKESE